MARAVAVLALRRARRCLTARDALIAQHHIIADSDIMVSTIRSHLSAYCSRNESGIDFVVFPLENGCSPEDIYRQATRFLLAGSECDVSIAAYIDQASMRTCAPIELRTLVAECLAITPLDGHLAPSLDHISNAYMFRREWNLVECVWFTPTEAWCMSWGTTA